jgi:hypothetical protein
MIERLKELDANHDGKIAKDEVPEQMLQMFERADTNKDGVIDEDELKALPERMASMRGQGGGRGGRGPGARAATPDPADEMTMRGGKILPLPALKAEPAPKTSPTAAAADDVVTGEWTAKAEGEELPQGMREFTLSVTLAEGGKVTGMYDTPRGGGGPLSEGKFDRENGAFTATIDGERSQIDIKAKIKDGKMKGEADIGGGRLQFEFEGERTSTTPAQAKADERSATPAGKPLLELLPGPRWVSSIETSRYKAGRVYATFDGHRSNDDEPYIYASEDYGRTWRSLRANLPTSAGSTKVIREDIQKENLLFLGTEFGAWVSVDRGLSWTRFNNNLPTVAVFEFALHPTTGELVAATHGRSLWILDITPLRQMTDKTAAEQAALFAPRTAVYWRPDPRRGGGNRAFVGDNGDAGASIVYSLGQRARGVSLKVTDQAGETIREFEPQTEPGLHRIVWDLRRTPEAGAAGFGGRGGRGGGGGGGGGGGAPGASAQGGGGPGAGPGGGFGRGGRLVPSGTYRIALKVNGETFTKPLIVQTDPQFPDYQPWERAGGFGGGDDEVKPDDDEEEDADRSDPDR